MPSSPTAAGAAAVPPPDVARANAALAGAPPSDVVRWAAERFGDGLVLTASFEDPVLVHVVATTAPATPVVLLDTQFLFAETRWYAEHLRDRLGFHLDVVTPLVARADVWQTDAEACCAARKVEPLERALAGRAAWLTGIRRVDGPTRADAPIVGWDERHRLVKINPLAAFTDDDMALYMALHDLPPNPLTERGYPSIGCWPCTRPVAPGEDRRAGRWSGQAKTECGLHT